jgi:putative endonuclease
MDYFYVYILSNWNHRVLYTGFTDDLSRRIFEHRSKIFQGFTSKYNCYKLLYYETFHSAEEAFHREKQLKRYRRAWKENLIRSMNPDFRDLYFDIKE